MRFAIITIGIVILVVNAIMIYCCVVAGDESRDI